MRWIAAAATASVLLCGSAALAQESRWGAEGQRGGAGPGGAISGGPTGGETIGADIHRRETQAGIEGEKTKPWQVEAIWETHRLVRQEDLGTPRNKLINAAFFYGRYDFTKYDEIWLRAGIIERFVGDEGESGFRADDIVGAYARAVPLPEKFSLRLTGQLSAPTSYASQKESLITEPRLTIYADNKSIDRFTFMARTFGSLHVTRYTSAEGGSANPKWTWAAGIGAEYRIHYIDVLTLGASLTNVYMWLYEPGYNASASQSARYGVSQDPNYGFDQPVQQSYSAEIYLRYKAPDIYDVHSDLTVAYAQGDPSIGFTSALHDGSRRVYPFFWRESSAVYATLSIAY